MGFVAAIGLVSSMVLGIAISLRRADRDRGRLYAERRIECWLEWLQHDAIYASDAKMQSQIDEMRARWHASRIRTELVEEIEARIRSSGRPISWGERIVAAYYDLCLFRRENAALSYHYRRFIYAETKRYREAKRDQRAERWLISLSYWLPRKCREAITGDILEDCHDMRELGFTERRILAHVLWQFTWAVIALWPETMGSAIAAVAKHAWKTKQ